MRDAARKWDARAGERARRRPGARGAASFGKLRVRVFEPHQIPRARLGSDFMKGGVRARVLAQDRNARVWVGDGSEDDGLRRTGLLARRADVAIGECAPLGATLDLGAPDALHAIG